MNVIIVDDEPIIRIGLRSMLDWESAGLRLVGEAEDGEEAWGLIEPLGVDLVITDLLMPRMDGLELLRRIREGNKDVSSIVLSCLDDFKWVKEAMKLGAKDYILKPTMEPEQLLQIMEEAKRELEERRTERNRVERWRQESEQSKQAQLTMKLQAYLLHGQADPRLEQDLFMSGKPLYSMLLYTGPHLALPELDWEGLGYSAVVRLEPDRMILLYEEYLEEQAEDTSIQTFGTKALQMCSELERQLEATEPESRNRHRTSDWFVGAGIRMDKLSDLPQALEWHEQQINDRFYNDSFDCIVTESPPVSRKLPLPYACRNDLLRAITHGNAHGFQFQAQVLGERLAEARRPIAELAAFVSELLTLTVSYARERGGFALMEQFEREWVQPNPIRSCSSMVQVQQLLEQVFAQLGMQVGSGTEQSASFRAPSPFVRRAIQFMREQYHRNISTADIAEHVKLSRSYLSDLYSKETGESLTETLTLIRMEEAKKKLRSGEMKVYEIAEAVGFPDSKTFVKAFKRIMGCTPKEYEMSNK